MRAIVETIQNEFRRYKSLADGAFSQVSDKELCEASCAGGLPLVAMGWHVAGNLASRFTDFLTTDGEKPWRDREGEFAARSVPRQEFTEFWERGFETLFGTLAGLSDAHLFRVVVIRGQDLTVHAALHRSLAHLSYHVGQIVHVAKALRREGWRPLSIPPGGSSAYNLNPTMDRPDAHAARLEET